MDRTNCILYFSFFFCKMETHEKCLLSIVGVAIEMYSNKG